MNDLSLEADKKNAAKELLLADYKYLSDSFWKNEEIGETRLKFFITLATAVLAGLATLLKNNNGLNFNNGVLSISVYSLLGLFVIGIVTLFRIIKRNQVTDGYKRDMDKIRELFKEHYDDGEVLSQYFPFRGSPKKNFPMRKIGGIAHTVAAINSLILATLSGVLLYGWCAAESSLLGAFLIFGLTFGGQFFYIQVAERSSKNP